MPLRSNYSNLFLFLSSLVSLVCLLKWFCWTTIEKQCLIFIRWSWWSELICQIQMLCILQIEIDPMWVGWWTVTLLFPHRLSIKSLKCIPQCKIKITEKSWGDTGSEDAASTSTGNHVSRPDHCLCGPNGYPRLNKPPQHPPCGAWSLSGSHSSRTRKQCQST